MSLSYGFNLDARGKTYSAEQFSGVFAHLIGDAVTDYGTGFELTLNTMLSFTIGTGYLYVNGYWLKSRYPVSFTLEGAYLSGTRYDAVAAVVDHDAREVRLEVLTDVDPEGQGASGNYYRMYLYLLEVQAGAVELYRANVIDKRPMLQRLDDTSADVSSVYDYLTNQFAGVISRFESATQDTIDSAELAADGAMDTIYTTMGLSVGCLRQTPDQPLPVDSWLLCDGSTFLGYSVLAQALGSNTLPDLQADEARLRCWIYAGIPD